MAEYKSDDFKSTLVYIKNRFGTEVFMKGRMVALFSDLAPRLEKDYMMLKRLSRIGILADFVSYTNRDEQEQQKMISRAMAQLTEAEFIQPAIAAAYLKDISEVFGWKIKIELPQKTEKFSSQADLYEFENKKEIFDFVRYQKESQEENFVLGKRALNLEDFIEAWQYLSRAYSQGNALAGVLLGIIYYRGELQEKNYDKAAFFFMNGMQKKCPLGADWLASLYKWGHGVFKNEQKAQELFLSHEEALADMCAAGSSDAQYAYGVDLLYGDFGKENQEEGLYWLQKAMKAGDIDAGVQVAKAYLNGWGTKKDTEQGIQILMKYADCVNKNAQYELGKVYYYGKGGERNYHKAHKHFLAAAQRNHIAAQNYLGDLYYFGQGVSESDVEARKWYELSEKQGDAYASSQLGILYLYGNGVPKDSQKAFEYFKFAADHGNAAAQYKLYSIYCSEGPNKNEAIGKSYLKKAAEQGYLDAQKCLAQCYFDDSKFDQGIDWLIKAAEQGGAEEQALVGRAYMMEECENYAEAVKWLAKAVEQNEVDAFISLAKIYLSVDGLKNEPKAREYMEKAHQMLMDDSDNCITFTLLLESRKAAKAYQMVKNYRSFSHKRLADLYVEYNNDQVSYYKSFDHCCKSYLGGFNLEALYNLGIMHFKQDYRGVYLDVSSEKLLQIIKEEAEANTDSDLLCLIGDIYFYGYKVKENEPEGVKWYEKAVEYGSLDATCELAIYYVDKEHLYRKGFSLLENAYERGSVWATRLLGLCYKKGIGVKKSRSKAKQLLKEAADMGSEKAAEELKKFLF